jgi:ABC-2 type transport system permease protein
VWRVIVVGWWLHLKMASRSAFDGILGILYPLFFATTVFFMYGQSDDPNALIVASVGASAMGVWSAVSTSAATTLQRARSQGTLELLVCAPRPFPLLIAPTTLALATIGLYSFVATLLWGRFAFDIHISISEPLKFIVASLALTFSIGLMGFLLAIVSVRYRSAWALGTAFEFPVWLLCGFVIPIGLLPNWTEPISKALPPTWGIEAMDNAASGHGAVWGAVALCVLLGVFYAVIAALLADRVINSARTNATLALS